MAFVILQRMSGAGYLDRHGITSVAIVLAQRWTTLDFYKALLEIEPRQIEFTHLWPYSGVVKL